LDEPPGFAFTDLILGDNLPYLFTTVIFLVLAGFVSASEAAFFSLTPEEVESFRRGKSEKEKLVSKLLGTPRLLLTVLTAWKYVMLMSCAVLFTIAISFTDEIGTITESLILTVFFAFLAVIIPKIYGTSESVRIVKFVSAFCYKLLQVTTPIVTPLLKMSYKVEEKLEEIADENSVKELTQALELAAVDKETTEDEKEILRGIVNFGTLTVADVMRPKVEINSVDATLNFHDLLIYIKKSGFSRIPVYNDDISKIQGVLYIKDLLPYLSEGKKFSWQKLLRPAYYVPDSKKIDLLLKEFQEKRVHMALVIDDAGELAGIITLEDIIEEIIGDIHDEFDEVGAYYKKVDDKTFIVDSKIPFSELCRLLDVDISVFPSQVGESDTLGSVLADLQDELPKIGDQISLDPFTFVVEAVDHKRIKKLRVHIHEEKEQ
jgi:putative hemolysin